MQTLRHIDEKLGLVPGRIVTQLGRIDEGRGREALYRQQRPAALERLVRVARIQSAESSNAIEGVLATPKRLRELMDERTDPRNRSEAEIAGYRSVLDLIHQSAASMPLTANIVLQLHRDLYQFSAEPGGRWKPTDNHIEERRPDGTAVVVFDTVPFAATAAAMDELHARMAPALAAGLHHLILLTGAYVLDFLCIHPFRDGNGRMARLLTLLLLYRGGYGVGRYVSLERLIESTKDSYYETLRRSSKGWHEGEHDPWPWIDYFTGILVAAYDTFESRVATQTARGAKSEAIVSYVDSLPAGGEFRLTDVRVIASGTSASHISKVLARLRDEGRIAPVGRGRGAHWVRLPADEKGSRPGDLPS